MPFSLAGILKTAIGAAAIAAAIIFPSPASPYLISAGAGLTISGVGTLIAGSHSQGISTATKNPISPWRYIYSEARVGGDPVYISTWGTTNQMLDLVLVIAAHPCQAITQVLFESAHINIDQKGVPYWSGGGPGYGRPTLGGSSYQPVQQSGDRAVSIVSITRQFDVVTVVMVQAIPSLQVGDTVIIQDTNGTKSLANVGLVGTFQVAELLDDLVTTFTYLNGGVPVTISAGSPPGGDTGQVSTNWVSYGRNVYFEYMLGNQCIGESFNGMVAGTPWQGKLPFDAQSGVPSNPPPTLVDPSLPNDNTAGDAPGWVGAPNPWTSFCSLAGKTCVFLRLQYGKDNNGNLLFPQGVPQISFLVQGKNDIYDPRLGDYGAPNTTGYTGNAALCIADFLHLGAVKGAPWSLTSPPTSYSAGALVSYLNVDYISCSDSNTTTPPNASTWTPVYNPTIWNPVTSYGVGALACYSDITSAVNWSSAITYPLHAVVVFWDFSIDGSSNIISQNAHQYVSVQAGNINHKPDGGVPGGSNPTWWKLYDGAVEYVSLTANNVGNAPASNPTHWRILPYLVTQAIPAGYCAPYIDPADSPAPPLNSINIPSLITAANVCDQPVDLARTGFEARYVCSGSFISSMRPGEILQNLLTSCAGRLTYVGGQYFIQPGYWVGTGSPPLTVDLQAIATGPFRWKPIVSVRDLYNGVKGTYISPSNRWESSDFPYYAQDTLHGYNGPAQYGGDINLAQDGGRRRWLDIHLPFTTSFSMAQRIAKIELLRRRNYGTGTFICNMSAYQYVPLDVVEADNAFLGWVGRILEVSAVRFRADKQPVSQGGGGGGGEDGGGTGTNANTEAVVLSVELDLQDTNSDIYVWSVFEELSPQGFEQLTPLSPSVIEALPFPWSPGYAVLQPGDALAPGPASFGMTPVFSNDANGALTANLLITGALPINDLDSQLFGPYITATASNTGGSLPVGNYVVGVTAYDSGDPPYHDTAYLDFATVTVTPSVAVARSSDGSGYYPGDLLIVGGLSLCSVYVTGTSPMPSGPTFSGGSITGIALSQVLSPNIQNGTYSAYGGHGTGATISVTVTSTTTGSINVTMMEWGSGDDGGDLYLSRPSVNSDQYEALVQAGDQLCQNVLHYQQSLTPGQVTATITDFNQSTPGGPDTIADHMAAVWQPVVHSGPWAQQIQSIVTAGSPPVTTITIAGPSMTTNQWAGYTLSLLAKYYNPLNATVGPTEIPYLNIPIASSGASSIVGPFVTFSDLYVGSDPTTMGSLTRNFSQIDVGMGLVITSGTGWIPGSYTMTALALGPGGVPNGLIVVSGAVATPNSTAGHGTEGGSEEFTLVVGTNAQGDTLANLDEILGVGDLVTARGQYTFGANYFYDLNVANGFYPSGDLAIEPGHLAVVLTGADAGDVQTIASVTNLGSPPSSGQTQAEGGAPPYVVFNLVGSWEITPATGDIVVVCEPSTASEWTAAKPFSISNASQPGGPLNHTSPPTPAPVVANINIQNLFFQTWLFTLRVCDAAGNAAPDFLAPKRDVYFFGGATKVIQIPSVDNPGPVYNVATNDSVILVVTDGSTGYADAGPVIVNLLPAAQMTTPSLMVKKVTADTNVVVVTAAAGELVEGQTQVVLASQWDWVGVKTIQ